MSKRKKKPNSSCLSNKTMVKNNVPSNVLKSLYSILMTWDQSEGRSTFLRLSYWFGVNVEGGEAESAARRVKANRQQSKVVCRSGAETQHSSAAITALLPPNITTVPHNMPITVALLSAFIFIYLTADHGGLQLRSSRGGVNGKDI